MKEFGKQSYFEDSITMPNESGKGIKLGSVDAGLSNFGWRDLLAAITVRGTAAGTSPETYTDPVWTILGATSFYAYKFIIGDQVWESFKLPHDVLPGSPVHFVANWVNGGISSPLDPGFVTWEFEYAFSKGYGQAAFDFAQATSPLTDSGTVFATEQLPTAAYQHMSTVTAVVSVPALTEPGGIIHTRIKRINNQTSPLNDAAEDILLLTTGIQYKSTNVATRQKSPGHYDLS